MAAAAAFTSATGGPPRASWRRAAAAASSSGRGRYSPTWFRVIAAKSASCSRSAPTAATSSNVPLRSKTTQSTTRLWHDWRMKVRWTGDSLRLRITPGELAALERGEPVSEGLARVGLTDEDVRRLAAPEAEGVYPHTPELRLLVEKDFPCAHPHAPEAREPATERFPPTPAFLD